MARLPYIERDQAPPEIQEAYDQAQKAMGRVSNLIKLMAHHPKSLPGFVAWYPRLREGALDIRLRQLAYVAASRLNGCAY